MEHSKREQNYINGKISQYFDAFVRQNKVWTPEQLSESFNEYISAYGPVIEYRGYEELWSSKRADDWLKSEDGRTMVLKRAMAKWERHNKLAKKEAPLVERVRLGHWWNKPSYFDISYGLKDGHNFKTAEEVERDDYVPWTIKHVEREFVRFEKSLPEILRGLSTSYLEKKFLTYWLENYYDNDNNPALIPEVCGFRSKFYYYKFNDVIYSSPYEIVEEVRNPEDIKSVNFRFDFFVANVKKRKAALIELDGYENHNSKNQKAKDSIKRNTAATHGISLFVFDTARIEHNLKECFAEINDFVR